MRIRMFLGILLASTVSAYAEVAPVPEIDAFLRNGCHGRHRFNCSARMGAQT